MPSKRKKPSIDSNRESEGLINGLDLFSGIGGISIALASWVKTIAYCENDRYAQAVLLSRMSDGGLDIAPIYDDVTTLKGEYLPEVDIIFGGFPCQDISVAGHGTGLEGKRSGLFFEIIRLTKEINPSFVFLENVPAIRTRGLREVVRAFAGLGYDCRWTCLSAAEVGAPHIRKRWFLLAHTNGETLRLESRRISWQSRRSSSLNSPNGNTWEIAESFKGTVEPRIFGNNNGVPFCVDRDKTLGNAVVPLQAKIAFERLIGL